MAFMKRKMRTKGRRACAWKKEETTKSTAITWWRISQERERIVSWKDFKDKFKVRFRPSIGSSCVDHLLSITQKGTVDEYMDRFEELAVELPHVSDDVLEAAFLKGLKITLKDQVVRLRPVNMADIVELAMLLEEQEGETGGYQVRSFSRTIPSSFSTQASPSQAKKPFESHWDSHSITSSKILQSHP